MLGGRPPSVAVVVLTYRPDTAGFEACLTSVLTSGGPDRVVVVDNGQSLDRPAVDRMVDASGLAMTVDLLTTEANLGFAGGMNAGISHALAHGAEAVAILNDDTVVEPGWLDALVVHLVGERIGAVQPKLLLDAPGTTEPVIASVGMWVRGDGAGIDLGHGEIDRGQYAEAVGIELFTGGAVLLAARFLADVGGFDERYFLYYEDIDLARRGRERGWQYLVEPRRGGPPRHELDGIDPPWPAPLLAGAQPPVVARPARLAPPGAARGRALAGPPREAPDPRPGHRDPRRSRRRPLVLARTTPAASRPHRCPSPSAGRCADPRVRRRPARRRGTGPGA